MTTLDIIGIIFDDDVNETIELNNYTTIPQAKVKNNFKIIDAITASLKKEQEGTGVLASKVALASSTNDMATQSYVSSNFLNLGSNAQTISGVKTFTALPVSSATPSNSNELTTKTYVDTKTTLSAVQSNNNVFSGSNSFTSLPTSSATPSNSNELTTKTYVDTKTTLSAVQSNDNVFSGSNSFTSLPTSSATPSNSNELTTKTYVDTKTTLSAVQSNNNTFSGSNSFTSLPTSSATPSSNNELTTKTYVDTKTTLSAVQSNNNSFTGSNSFTSLPTSSATPSSSNQLTTKTYVDSSISALVGSSPSLLNTLQEINSAINNDPNFNDTIVGQLATKGGLSSANEWTGANEFKANFDVKGTNLNPITINLGKVGGTDAITINSTTTINEDVTLSGSLIVNSVNLNQNELSKVQYLSNITSDVKGLIDAKTTNTAIQGNANNWTNTNNYDIMPTSSSTITLNNHLTNKEYVDNKVNSLLGTENYFTERNYFNDYLPKSTLTPSNGQHFVTKNYCDGKVSDMLTNNNSWEGLNHFNVSLPSSTQTPVNDGDLTTKIFCDETYLKLAGNADITGTKNFQNISVSGTTTLSGNVSCVANVNLGSDSGDIITITGTTSANGVSLSPSTISKVQYLSNTTSSVQDQLNSKTTLSEVQGNANTFTNANTFDTTITSKEGVLFPYVSVSGSQVPQYLEWRNNAGGSNGSISSSTSDGILINTPTEKNVSFSSGDLNNIVATITPNVPIYATDVVTRQYGLRENLQFVFNYGQTFSHNGVPNTHYSITPSVDCYLNFTKTTASFQTALVEITYSISVSTANSYTLSNNISYHAVYLVRTSTPVPVSGNPVSTTSVHALVMNKFSSVMPDPTTQLTFTNGLTSTTYQPVRFLGTSTNGNRVRILFGFPNVANNKTSNNAWINATSASARIISSAPNTTDGTMTYPNTLKSLSNLDFQQNSVGGCHITRT